MFILFIVRNNARELLIAFIFMVCYIITLIFSVEAYNHSVEAYNQSVKAYNHSAEPKDDEKNLNIRIAQIFFNATILLGYSTSVLNYLIGIFVDCHSFKITLFTLNTYTAAASTIIAILEFCIVQKKCCILDLNCALNKKL